MNAKVNNEASGIIVDLPLVDSVEDIDIIKKSIRKNFRPEKIFSVGMTADILGNIFSWHIISYFAKLFTKRFDYMFTNVPGPAETLYYHGIEVSGMSPLTCDSAASFLRIMIISSCPGEAVRTTAVPACRFL